MEFDFYLKHKCFYRISAYVQQNHNTKKFFRNMQMLVMPNFANEKQQSYI